MSGDNIEDQFKQFLADNKIDTSALSGTKDEGKLLKDAKDQRTLGILKAVSLDSSLPAISIIFPDFLTTISTPIET
jgi:hypothetical protein